MKKTFEETFSKIKQISFLDWILISLGLHLLLINTKLLYNLNYLVNSDSFGETGNLILSIFISLSYSTATIYSLRQDISKWLKLIFALIDGFLVLLWYNSLIPKEYYIITATTLYAFFTTYITLILGNLAYKKKKIEVPEVKNEELSKIYDKIGLLFDELKRNEISIDEIKTIVNNVVKTNDELSKRLLKDLIKK